MRVRVEANSEAEVRSKGVRFLAPAGFWILTDAVHLVAAGGRKDDLGKVWIKGSGLKTEG